MLVLADRAMVAASMEEQLAMARAVASLVVYGVGDKSGPDDGGDGITV